MLTKVKDLEPGMVLGRDLTHSGMTLLREGAVLTDLTINILRHRGIGSVDIAVGSVRGPSAMSSSQTLKELGLADDGEYRRKRAELEELFAGIQKDDPQMQMLRYCMFSQLEEGFRES